MNVPLRPWQLILLAAGIVVAAVGLVALTRTRRGSTLDDQLNHLPVADATVIYLDVKALRGAGLLSLLAGSRLVEDPEYREFVGQSGFDYREDLDSVLLTLSSGRAYMLAGGRFDWAALHSFARRQHGGSCWNGFCRVPASEPGRTISFYPFQQRMIALAVTEETWGVARLAPRRRPAAWRVPSEPVWVILPASRFDAARDLPELARPLASMLAGVERVLLGLELGRERFAATLEADCRSTMDARRIVGELQSATAALRQTVARRNQPSAPQDLSGLLAAGEFQHAGRLARGRWPMERRLLESLVGAARE